MVSKARSMLHENSSFSNANNQQSMTAAAAAVEKKMPSHSRGPSLYAILYHTWIVSFRSLVVQQFKGDQNGGTIRASIPVRSLSRLVRGTIKKTPRNFLWGV